MANCLAVLREGKLAAERARCCRSTTSSATRVEGQAHGFHNEWKVEAWPQGLSGCLAKPGSVAFLQGFTIHVRRREGPGHHPEAHSPGRRRRTRQRSRVQPGREQDRHHACGNRRSRRPPVQAACRSRACAIMAFLRGEEAAPRCQPGRSRPWPDGLRHWRGSATSPIVELRSAARQRASMSMRDQGANMSCNVRRAAASVAGRSAPRRLTRRARSSVRT